MYEIAAGTASPRNDIFNRHCEGFSPKQSYIDTKEIAASPTAPRNDIKKASQ